MTSPAPDASSAAEQSLRDRARARAGRASLLLFRVGTEYFGTDLAASEEALELADHPVHGVPGRTSARLGVVEVRGLLVPIYSPRQVLGLPAASAAPEMALVFPTEDGRVAIAVDDVEDVFTADLARLHEAPAGGRGAIGVLLGALHHGALLVGIVDADGLVAACRAESNKPSASTLALETA